MADNMTIGPAISIGGNTVQMTQKGKVQVTNAHGKVKTLSQDQFKKQLVKNANNIETGKDFEFKKDNKTALIAGSTVAAAAIATGIVYRKDIAKYAKDFSWKGFKEDARNLFQNTKKATKRAFKTIKTKISNLFGKKNAQTIYDGNLKAAKNAEQSKIAEEALNLKNSSSKYVAESIINNIENIKANSKNTIHVSKQKMYERLFSQNA